MPWFASPRDFPDIAKTNSKTVRRIRLGIKSNNKNMNSHHILGKKFKSPGQFSRKSTKTTLKKHPPCAPIGTAPEGAGRARSPAACSKALEKCCQHMSSSSLEGPFKAFGKPLKKVALDAPRFHVYYWVTKSQPG